MAGFLKPIRELLKQKNLIDQVRLSFILKSLANRGGSPKHIELTPTEAGFFASVFDENPSGIISECVSIGFSDSASLAALKGVVEHLERKAFDYGRRCGIASCQTERSDGFAAFPKLFRTDRQVHRLARINAWHEAVERYCWATWWDSHSIEHNVIGSQTILDRFPASRDILNSCAKLCSLSGISAIVIEPMNTSVQVVILLGQDSNGGYVTGGAAGSMEDESTVIRAGAELFRHCLALKRMKSENLRPESFYQKRLAFFGFGSGKELVEERLSARGNEKISLPKLAFDEDISHPNDDLVVVHRCLFDNQPPFVGGCLERLCI